MLELKDAQPSFRDHSIAAQAASNLGNMFATYKRVKRAYALEQTEELKVLGFYKMSKHWLPSNRCQVGLLKKTFTLKAKEEFYEPDDQNAFDFAQVLSKKRKFKGLLPYGEYTIGNESFTVAPFSFLTM